MGEPANFAFVRCPRCKSIAVEAVDSHDTGPARISVWVVSGKSVMLTRFQRWILGSVAP